MPQGRVTPAFLAATPGSAVRPRRRHRRCRGDRVRGRRSGGAHQLPGDPALPGPRRDRLHQQPRPGGLYGDPRRRVPPSPVRCRTGARVGHAGRGQRLCGGPQRPRAGRGRVGVQPRQRHHPRLQVDQGRRHDRPRSGRQRRFGGDRDQQQGLCGRPRMVRRAGPDGAACIPLDAADRDRRPDAGRQRLERQRHQRRRYGGGFRRRAERRPGRPAVSLDPQRRRGAAHELLQPRVGRHRPSMPSARSPAPRPSPARMAIAPSSGAGRTASSTWAAAAARNPRLAA